MYLNWKLKNINWNYRMNCCWVILSLFWMIHKTFHRWRDTREPAQTGDLSPVCRAVLSSHFVLRWDVKAFSFCATRCPCCLYVGSQFPCWEIYKGFCSAFYMILEISASSLWWILKFFSQHWPLKPAFIRKHCLVLFSHLSLLVPVVQIILAAQRSTERRPWIYDALGLVHVCLRVWFPSLLQPIFNISVFITISVVTC